MESFKQLSQWLFLEQSLFMDFLIELLFHFFFFFFLPLVFSENTLTLFHLSISFQDCLSPFRTVWDDYEADEAV